MSVSAISFQGGGVKCIVYAGALDALSSSNVIRPGALRVVAGTSAGAIVAMAYACRPEPSSIRNMLAHAEFRTFARDMSIVPGWLEAPFDLVRLFRHGGLNSGARLQAWLKSRVGDVTLGDIEHRHGRELRVWVYDMVAREAVCLGSRTHPHIPAWRAVAASCAIQGYFQPVVIDGRPCSDGGMLMNSPLWAFPDEFEPTDVIGLRPYNQSSRAAETFDGRFGVIDVVRSVALGFVEDTHRYRTNGLPVAFANREISCDALGVRATDWALHEDTIRALVLSGHTAASAWVARHAQ